MGWFQRVFAMSHRGQYPKGTTLVSYGASGNTTGSGTTGTVLASTGTGTTTVPSVESKSITCHLNDEVVTLRNFTETQRSVPPPTHACVCVYVCKLSVYTR
jgi:photosystem II stability/assembly factor-like uncharacterized protein